MKRNDRRRGGLSGRLLALAAMIALPAGLAKAAGTGGELRQPLERHYLRNWLVAGPQVIRVSDVSPFKGADDDATKANVLRHFRVDPGEVARTPREGTSLRAGETEFPWRHYQTRDDRTVSFNEGGGCVYLKAWAYAQLETPEALEGEWEVGAHGPVDVWVNGRRVLQRDERSIFVPLRHRFTAALAAGRNDVLVRFEAVKIRVGVFGMSLRLPDTAAGIAVVLPTELPETAARQDAARAIEAAFLDREVFDPGEPVVIRWADAAGREAVPLELEVRDASGNIREQRRVAARRGAEVVIDGAGLSPGRHSVRLVPAAISHAEVRELAAGSLSFAVRADDTGFASRPYGTFEQRRREMLEATARGTGLNAEIARMHLGHWQEIDPVPFLRAAEKINRRQDTSDFEMTALLGAMLRHGAKPAFPSQVRTALEACILGFKYWADEPGEDVMWFWSENHQIAFHACEVMAGQLFPDRIFTNAGQTGRWHREKGEGLARTWLRKRAAQGFHEWDSNTYFYIDILALSHLADLAEDAEVRHLAEVVLSKMMLCVALNSYRGVFGSAHARTYPGEVKSGRHEGTSGSAWLSWGLSSRGYSPLALMARYRVPSVVGRIATAEPPEFWNRERHGGELDPAVDHFSGPWEVNKVTYRTADYQLSSAQDHRAGQRGNMQHIWQATLGPDAPVFVNHPPFMAESGSPNFWVGNLVLPRVAQWRDVLIDVRRIPAGQGMGFTHAFFPLHAFDETLVAGGWILARKGDGYVALTSRAGVAMLQSGRYARREFRSHADEDIWTCHLGSRRQDGTFADFCAAIREMPVSYEGASVRMRTLRGDTLTFGWEGPFLRNGEQVPLSGYPHFDNPYVQAPFPASRLEIRVEDEVLELAW